MRHRLDFDVILVDQDLHLDTTDTHPYPLAERC